MTHAHKGNPNGFATLLVALNLMLLCFFVLLNSLATAPDPQQNKQMQKVLAEIKEGYDIKAPQVAEDGTTPRVPTAPWAVDMASKLQGVVVNRLKLNTAEMQADASRVVLKLPLNTLFAKEGLVGIETIRAFMLAAQGSQLQWQLHAPTAQLLPWAAALVPVTGQVAMIEDGLQELRLIVKPNPEVPSRAGRGLEALGGAQGAVVQGEVAP